MGTPAFLHPFAKPAKEAAGFTTLVRGDGCTLWDRDGRSYIDAMASLWYCNAGHGNRRIIEATTAQLNSLATYNTFDPWTNEPAEQLAETIAGLAPMENPRVFFTCSGSEAVDTALKLARLTHNLAGDGARQVLVTRDGGYHGTAYGGTSVQGIPANQAGFGELVPGVVTVPQHDIEAVSRLFSERGSQIAAVIAEPLQGAGGVHPPAPGYLAGLRKLCDQHGALLIFDEVICGWGRLGQWFGAQHYGVVPDLITFAKGVTSGYVPLGGVIVNRRVCDALESDPDYVLRHGYTYSGHPTSCAAGVAALGVYRDEGLFERAGTIATILGGGLQALVEDGMLTSRRGEGGVWAAELPEGRDAMAVRDTMLAQGVIARPLGTAIAFCPPLIITEDELGRVLDALATALR
ncbi:MAG: aspartate aminotransferase family protein [Acidimicrobiales bacterium]